jgi:hypothetical protein
MTNGNDILEWLEQTDEFELMHEWITSDPQRDIEYHKWLQEKYNNAAANAAEDAYDAWRDRT